VEIKHLAFIYSAEIFLGCAVTITIHLNGDPIERTVNLVGGGEEEEGILTGQASGFQHLESAACVYLEIGDWIMNRSGHRDLSRKMEDIGGILSRLAKSSSITNVTLYDLEPLASWQGAKPLHIMDYTVTGEVIVDTNAILGNGKQSLRKIGSYEACASCNQYRSRRSLSHESSSV
jgi:hypothetical protein